MLDKPTLETIKKEIVAALVPVFPGHEVDLVDGANALTIVIRKPKMGWFSKEKTENVGVLKPPAAKGPWELSYYMGCSGMIRPISEVLRKHDQTMTEHFSRRLV